MHKKQVFVQNVYNSLSDNENQYYFLPSVAKILRAKNMKLKSKVGTAKRPVLHRIC